MSLSRSVLYVGLPASGKTTFLALLYRAIAAGHAGELRLGAYRDDREYVNDVAKRLARCEEAQRTQTDHDEQQLGLSLRFASEEMFLRIPDMSGELWSHVLEDRRWSVDLDRDVAEATGFVLFVHSDRIDPDPLIDDVEDGTDALTGEKAPEGETTGVPTGLGDEVRRTRGTQVELVDLVQLLARRRRPHAIRLSIIASAWDLQPETLVPADWLIDDLPLLSQFLETNSRQVEWDVWGVSAQGGDFSNSGRRDELLRRDVVERAIVKARSGDSSTIAAPMKWALRII